jgi:hypothetical protein
MRGNCLFLMGLLLIGSPAMGDGIADRDVIVSRMNQFLDITLETNTQMDDECLALNLEHPNYQTACCSRIPMAGIIPPMTTCRVRSTVARVWAITGAITLARAVPGL